MKFDEQAEALRQQVDDLAQRCAGIEDWELADARLCAALAAGRSQLVELHRKMVELAETTEPSWCWFETHASVRGLIELLADLRVLHICVQSRIYELEAGASQPAG